jgi:DNA-binding protein H-NS
MALKSMSIEKLVELKDQIEAMLSSKVVEQRRTLESKLAKLGRF